MFWDSWFKAPVLPKPTSEDMWKTTTYSPANNTFPFDKLKVLADSEGNIKLDMGGTNNLTIPACVRHAFLEKIQRAVDMADVADPSNEPLMKGMNGESK